MNIDDADDYVCKDCESPCENCKGGPKTCTSCDGTDGKEYLYKSECYNECPSGTALNLGLRLCLDCSANCKKCSDVGDVCFECYEPFLLDEGRCVSECTRPGYHPNIDETMCTNKVVFPDLGPMFSIISGVGIIVSIVAWLINRQTNLKSTIIALLSVCQSGALVL